MPKQDTYSPGDAFSLGDLAELLQKYVEKLGPTWTTNVVDIEVRHGMRFDLELSVLRNFYQGGRDRPVGVVFEDEELKEEEDND